jgi:hypothetical protein
MGIRGLEGLMRGLGLPARAVLLAAGVGAASPAWAIERHEAARILSDVDHGFFGFAIGDSQYLSWVDRILAQSDSLSFGTVFGCTEENLGKVRSFFEDPSAVQPPSIERVRTNRMVIQLSPTGYVLLAELKKLAALGLARPTDVGCRYSEGWGVDHIRVSVDHSSELPEILELGGPFAYPVGEIEFAEVTGVIRESDVAAYVEYTVRPVLEEGAEIEPAAGILRVMSPDTGIGIALPIADLRYLPRSGDPERLCRDAEPDCPTRIARAARFLLYDDGWRLAD